MSMGALLGGFVLGVLITSIVIAYSKTVFLIFAKIFINQQKSRGETGKIEIKNSKKNLVEVKEFFEEVSNHG